MLTSSHQTLVSAAFTRLAIYFVRFCPINFLDFFSKISSPNVSSAFTPRTCFAPILPLCVRRFVAGIFQQDVRLIQADGLQQFTREIRTKRPRNPTKMERILCIFVDALCFDLPREYF